MRATGMWRRLCWIFAMLAWACIAPARAGDADPGSYIVVSESYGSWTGGPNITADVHEYFDTPDSYVTNVLGISMDAVPLRATVHRPLGLLYAPIVFLLHGNHDPAEPSYPGFAWLQQHLASRGYVVVSIDEDFLNGAVGEMDARAIVLLRHLELWREWSQTNSHPYYRVADMNRVALIGHSRGGEAIVVAKKFNSFPSTPYWPFTRFNFPISALFALAPTDKLILADLDPMTRRRYFAADKAPDDPAQAQPPVIDDSTYGVLQGSHDEEVVFFVGQNQYERAQPVTQPATRHKSAFFIYGANHKHFNSVWAAPCLVDARASACADGAVAPRPLERLITPAETQAIARTLVTAFLRHNLPNTDTRDVLTQRGADPGLPAGITVLSRYQDKDRVMLDHFEEDTDPATGSLAGVTNADTGLAQHEQLYLFPNERWSTELPLVAAAYPYLYVATDAVLLGWDSRTDEYRISFDGMSTVGPLTSIYPVFSFDVAQLYERTPERNAVGQATDFSVRVRLENYFDALVDGPSRLVSVYATLPYPDRVTQDGANGTGSDFTQGFLRTVRIPLADLIAGTGLPASRIRGVTLRFNQKPTGRIVIDNVQLTK